MLIICTTEAEGCTEGHGSHLHHNSLCCGHNSGTTRPQSPPNTNWRTCNRAVIILLLTTAHRVRSSPWAGPRREGPAPHPGAHGERGQARTAARTTPLRPLSPSTSRFPPPGPHPAAAARLAPGLGLPQAARGRRQRGVLQGHASPLPALPLQRGHPAARRTVTLPLPPPQAGPPPPLRHPLPEPGRRPLPATFRPRRSGPGKGRPSFPPHLSRTLLIVAPAEGGGGKPADTGSQHGTERAAQRSSPLRDLPAAPPAPSGSGRRGRKGAGGKWPLPRGMMGAVVPRLPAGSRGREWRPVVRRALRLRGGSVPRSPPLSPAAILSAARWGEVGGAGSWGAAGEMATRSTVAVAKLRRDKRKRKQLR